MWCTAATWALQVFNLKSSYCPSVHCVSKETSPIFLTVTWKPIVRFWLFLVWLFLTQLAIKWPFSFPPHPAFVSALPGENTTNEISLYPMQYDGLVNIMRKNTFCSHFWHFVWHFIQLSIFQLPAVKLLEVLSLIHIWRCRRIERCRSRWSPYH